MKLFLGDSLKHLKEIPDTSVDIIFCDPPYALGSEITIRPDGKPDYKKAVDFMNKWEMPTGAFWEEFYKEAYRVLKYGGHCLMYGMDRQNFVFKYYGHLAGFQGKQSLYWYFISNFPKASDLSKMIDKNAGAEREVIGTRKAHDIRNNALMEATDENLKKEVSTMEYAYTIATTPLAKKYSGYKYSVAPLKQVVEEIMVFQKPMKTGSVLHDTLAIEGGDDSITCGALAIDQNRVGTEKRNNPQYGNGGDLLAISKGGKQEWDGTKEKVSGRYPAQAFIDSEVAKIIGEPSKVLHKCQYETEEHDLFIYSPKVSKKERNAGCEEMEDKKYSHDGRKKPIENPYQKNDSVAKNTHPTLKPISLNEKILRLFKTPNPQKILILFAGSGSEMIGAFKAKYEEIEGSEINPEYVKIAEARIKHYTQYETLV